MHKDVSKVEFSSTSAVLVDGIMAIHLPKASICKNHEDEACIIIYRPLSYATAEMAENYLEICPKEIRLMGKLKKCIKRLPVFGVNSSGDDIPLNKNYFLPKLARLVPSDELIQFVKKRTGCVSITGWRLQN